VIVPRILAITPGDGRELGPWLGPLVDAGLRAVVLRERGLDPALIETLVQGCPDLRVIVHHRAAGHGRLPPGVGLHLPGSVDPTPFRSQVTGLLGASCHSAAEVDAAFAAGVDYALLSPVWRPTSKPGDLRSPLGPDRFVAMAAGRPVLALGGLTPARHHALRARGAHGSALLGPLFGSSVQAAAEALRAFLRAKSQEPRAEG
jgi:thiamine monophosphate synthase